MTNQNNIYKITLAVLLLAQFMSAIPGDVPFLGAIWFLWIFICLYYAFKLCLEKRALHRNSYVFLLLIFWAMNAISFMISPKHLFSYLLFLEANTLVIFKSITIALFSFFPFYYFFKSGYIKESNFKSYVFLLFIGSVLNLISGYFLQAQETSEKNNVVNEAYLFVQLIPLFFIFFRGRQQYLLMAVSALLILWGSKRGAILCMGFEMIVFFVYLWKEDTFGRKHRGIILLLVGLMVCVGVYFVLGNEFLQERLLNTGSEVDKSGDVRTERYLALWTIYFNNSSVEELLFGYGFAQTFNLGGGLAHQDWIELLIDNGFVGLLLYVVLIGACVKNILKWNNCVPKSVKYALVCCTINWCLTATYSMVYASRESFIFFLSLGIIYGFLKQHNQKALSQRKKCQVYNY